MALDNLAAEIKRTYKTQAAFADAMDVDQKTVCNWIGEKTYPTIRQCFQMKELLNCKLEYLFDGIGEERDQ